MLLKERLDQAEAEFRRSGIESPRGECRTLACRILKIERWQLRDYLHTRISPLHLEGLNRALTQWAMGMPVAYILGEKDFFSQNFFLNSACLIPRPESEALVTSCIDFLSSMNATMPSTGTPTRVPKARILDLGTGSGCLSIACLISLKEAHAWAVDFSLAAACMAKNNARTHGVIDRFHIWNGDWLGALARDTTFDAIIANPPYISSNSINRNLRYEPVAALDGGPDGCDVYRHLAKSIPQHMAVHSRCFMEVDLGKIDILNMIFPESRWYRSYTNEQNGIAVLNLDIRPIARERITG